MTTFYDLKKGLHFNGLVGALRAQSDLWTFFDILHSLQTDVIRGSHDCYLALTGNGEDSEEAEKKLYAFHLMVRMLDHDMQKIEAYCRSRGIERGE